MSNKDVIIVDKVSKDFKLPHQKRGSVKNIFTDIFSMGQSSYEVQHALKDISFTIKQGEFFGIVGRNGSGKSTLLKILAGIYQPTNGSIHIGGRVVPFIELGVGFNGELTGRENVYLNGALLGFSEKEIDAKYDDIVDFAEIERFMDQKLKNYSSGMQVRLAFSVATRLAESDILLIDEVLAVGDADFQRKCFRYFKQLKKEKKTAIFVTHDMNAVREYCDRAAFIDSSRLMSIDEPDKIAIMYEKLLMPKNKQGSESESDKRWGDGTVEFVDAKLVHITDKEVKVRVRLKALADCADPVYGFSMKNGAGLQLAGTNTTLEKIKNKPLEKGETQSIEWTFSNVFSDGTYFLSLAIAYEGGHTMAQWWEEAVMLDINRRNHNPYPVYPDIDFRIADSQNSDQEG